jgi:hypothetical protein
VAIEPVTATGTVSPWVVALEGSASDRAVSRW